MSPPALDPVWLHYWFLFPLGLLIASVAMSSGVAGSNFWVLVYLVWLGLEPRTAFWVSLLTMLFGFGSGVWRNLRAGTIDFGLVGRYLLFAGPAAVVGARISTRVDPTWLLLAFAAFVIVYGTRLLARFFRDHGLRLRTPAFLDRRHERIYWPVALLAGLLQGTIATGSGVLLLPCLIDHRRIRHHSTAVGSTVLLVFTLSLISVSLRVDRELFAILVAGRESIAAMMVWAAPGVLVGGQLGPRMAQRIPRDWLRLYVGLVLWVIGGLVAFRALA